MTAANAFDKCRFLSFSPHLNRVFRKPLNTKGLELLTFDLCPTGRGRRLIRKNECSRHECALRGGLL
jgi:hypothetical protein